MRGARFLLWLAPKTFRSDYTGEVIATMRDVWAASYRRGGWMVAVREGALEWVNLAWTAVAVRFGRGPQITAGSGGRRPRTSRGQLMVIDDVRHALRRVRSQPGTAALAAGMLAVAVGVTAAMFTVADHMLLRPAPFRDPDHLVRVSIGADEKHGRAYLDRAIVRAFRSTPAFTDVEAFIQDPGFIESSDGLVSQGAIWITTGAFDMLGVSPLRGRTFAMGEGRPGSDDRVIISERVWRTAFAADPSIIGRLIALSGSPVTVVGVMPAAFHFPYENTAIWRPLDLDAPPVKFAMAPLETFARLARALPPADASRIATAAATEAVPPKHAGDHVMFRPSSAGSLDDYSRTAIVVLAAGVGLVFLVLCANVMNLVLARATSRRQEFGVCSALGASRGRLLRQAFIENAMIGMAGSCLGLVVAWGLIALARSFLPDAFLIRTLNPIDVDLRAVFATSVCGLVATVAAGLPPAWIGTSVNASDSVKLASRGGTESRASRAWTRSLLVGEVALATTLLVGAGVLVQSFVKLVRADRGLDSHGIVTSWISLPEMYFADRPSRATFAATLRDQVSSLPGVTGVALSNGLPPGGGGFSWGTLETDSGTTSPDDTYVFTTSVGPQFFQVYRIALLEGRDFQPGDTRDQVVVGESLARMLWPGGSAVGRSFRFRDEAAWNHVIGVAREVRSPLNDPRGDLPEFYRPLTLGSSQVMIGLRCDDACPSEAAIRERVRATSTRAILYKLTSLDAAYLEQYARPRAAAALAFTFALFAVVASAGGLFSVLSYAVGRRRREFGIRAAMGAQPAQLRRLILGDGLRVAVVGLAIGAIAAWALSRSLAALAFGVTAHDPLVWLSVVGVIGSATVLAAWRPALAAMRSDPLTLLRED
jgi:predicted permease